MSASPSLFPLKLRATQSMRFPDRGLQWGWGGIRRVGWSSVPPGRCQLEHPSPTVTGSRPGETWACLGCFRWEQPTRALGARNTLSQKPGRTVWLPLGRERTEWHPVCLRKRGLTTMWLLVGHNHDFCFNWRRILSQAVTWFVKTK